MAVAPSRDTAMASVRSTCMDVFTTPGAFSWSELITPDPESAKIFYAKLFGWSTREA